MDALCFRVIEFSPLVFPSFALDSNTKSPSPLRGIAMKLSLVKKI